MEVGNFYWKGCIQHGSRQHLLEVLEKPQEWAPAVFPISLQIYSKEARKWKLVRSETGGLSLAAVYNTKVNIYLKKCKSCLFSI